LKIPPFKKFKLENSTLLSLGGQFNLLEIYFLKPEQIKKVLRDRNYLEEVSKKYKF
jgi:hypothetical protein